MTQHTTHTQALADNHVVRTVRVETLWDGEWLHEDQFSTINEARRYIRQAAFWDGLKRRYRQVTRVVATN